MKLKVFIAGLILLVCGVFLSGCTESERRGYSKIPQNSPAAWEQSSFVI
ncbi:MAG: hypothetical protein MST10_06440 [Lentisphaeria bacterium]|nr:hypothetical protein [Lentisphaeria bacterium]